MRILLLALMVVTAAGVGRSNAADGCGPGCHSTSNGGCVVDGWGTGAPVWNECPAGARPRPPCGGGYLWQPRYQACVRDDSDPSSEGTVHHHHRFVHRG